MRETNWKDGDLVWVGPFRVTDPITHKSVLSVAQKSGGDEELTFDQGVELTDNMQMIEYVAAVPS